MGANEDLIVTEPLRMYIFTNKELVWLHKHGDASIRTLVLDEIKRRKRN